MPTKRVQILLDAKLQVKTFLIVFHIQLHNNEHSHTHTHMQVHIYSVVETSKLYDTHKSRR